MVFPPDQTDNQPVAPPSFYIQQAGEGAIALLAELGAITFWEAFAADNDPADMARYLAEAFSEAKIAEELRAPGARFWLAYDPVFDPDYPVGYVRLRERFAPPHLFETRAIEISRLYLRQAAIGCGYGSALMRACLERAIAGNFDTLWLGVWEDNLRAVRFYERWGFRMVGTQTFRLGTSVQTDWIMARSVPPMGSARLHQPFHPAAP